VNYAFARDQYRKSKNAALSSLSDPHEMVGLTLKELARSLNALQNISLTDEQRNAHLSKGFTAVYILQTSLDFDKGFEIASNLFKIYEFIREQLQKTLKRDATTNLRVCSDILDDIIDAWNNIK
jgi:flagellar protein FliS